MQFLIKILKDIVIDKLFDKKSSKMLPRGYIDEPRPKPEPTPFQGTSPISGCGCLGGTARLAQRFG